MLRRKFLVQVCGHDWSTLRIEPPLIVTEAQCREFVTALREELDWIHGHG
jgi:4-aminobutyrate aminotransferase-like enzyme